MNEFLKILRIILEKYVEIVQVVIIKIILCLIYFFLFSITWIFIAIFNRRFLNKINCNNTFWVKSIGYSPDMGECMRES